MSVMCHWSTGWQSLFFVRVILVRYAHWWYSNLANGCQKLGGPSLSGQSIWQPALALCPEQMPRLEFAVQDYRIFHNICELVQHYLCFLYLRWCHLSLGKIYIGFWGNDRAYRATVGGPENRTKTNEDIFLIAYGAVIVSITAYR